MQPWLQPVQRMRSSSRPSSDAPRQVGIGDQRARHADGVGGAGGQQRLGLGRLVNARGGDQRDRERLVQDARRLAHRIARDRRRRHDPGRAEVARRVADHGARVVDQALAARACAGWPRSPARGGPRAASRRRTAGCPRRARRRRRGASPAAPRGRSAGAARRRRPRRRRGGSSARSGTASAGSRARRTARCRRARPPAHGRRRARGARRSPRSRAR